MSKVLEKVLKDAMKEKNCTLGTKQVLGAMKDSKFVVVSNSIPKDITEQIQEHAKKKNVPTMQFKGSSVALGRLCGLQFRVSTVSLTSISDSNIKSIVKESETQ